MASTPSVGVVKCRGGCGQELDPDLYPLGICPDCEAREHRKNAEEWRGR